MADCRTVQPLVDGPLGELAYYLVSRVSVLVESKARGVETEPRTVVLLRLRLARAPIMKSNGKMSG